MILDPDPGPWMNTETAAPLLGVSQRVLQTMCANGEIKHRALKSRTGLHTRYRLSQRCIDEYIARTTVPVRRA